MCGKQIDSVSCGVFVVQHARLLLRGLPLEGPNVPRAYLRRTDKPQHDADVLLIRMQIARELRANALEHNLALPAQ